MFVDTTAEKAREQETVERVKADIKGQHLTPRRMVAQWGVHNWQGEVVAVFPFKGRADADALCAELTAASKFKDETYYVQLVKEKA